MKKLMYLQLLSDGGAPSGDGGAATGVEGAPPVAQEGEDLSKVIYGKSNNPGVADQTDAGTPPVIDPAEKQKTFNEMVKKGGEYHDEYNKLFQDQFNKRFKENKGLEETLKSHESILGLLAAKYGVDASDTKALEDALNNDNSLFEEAAFKEGLTPEQYRQKLQLEQENARLKEAQEQLEIQKGSEAIYARWCDEADAMCQRYGINNFDMALEMENPLFTQMLSSGVSFEAAYKAIHFDDMLGAGMAATAQNVSQAMVNNIQSRSRRPAENGTSAATSTIFKADPSKFTVRDLDEIKRRVAAGEEIAL